MLRFKNGFHGLASRLAWRFAAPVALCAGLLASAPASAASLTQVPSGWQVGTEPSWVSMYWYVPDNTPGGRADHRARPLLQRKRVGHLRPGAVGRDRHDRPTRRRSSWSFRDSRRNCWDVATTHSLTHDGTNNDMKAIVDMVKYTITKQASERQPRLRDGRLVRRHGDAGAARGRIPTCSREAPSSQGFRRDAGPSATPTVEPVELAVRGRPGRAHPAWSGGTSLAPCTPGTPDFAPASSSGTGRRTPSSTTPITPRPSSSGPTCSGCPRPRRRRRPCRSAATTTIAGNGKTPAGSRSSTRSISPTGRTVRTRT